MKILSPTVCLKPNSPPFDELPLNLINERDIPLVEMQRRMLLNVDFITQFDGSVPTRGAILWARIVTMTNAEGEFIFNKLATLALVVYSLGISNATVERE